MFAALGVLPGLLGWPRKPKPGNGAARLLGVVAFTTLLSISMTANVILLDWQRTSWRAASAPNLSLATLKFVLCAALGLIAYHAARRAFPAEPAADSPEADALRLGETESVYWWGRARNAWLAAMAGALAISALVSARWSSSAAVAQLVAACALIPFRRIDVSVSALGLKVHYGLFGWPRQRLALERIVRVEAIEVVPMAHGGWGYRGSLTLFKRAALVIRRGSALSLELTAGQRFAVTLDAAETAS